MNTLLIVTDQPFWRRENGSHQRSWALYQFLLTQNFDVTIFFMVNITETDRALAKEIGLQIVEFNSTAPWFVKAAGHVADVVKRAVRYECSPSSMDAAGHEFKPVTLETYRWPEAQTEFRKLIDKLRPDFVLINYIVWANLLESLPLQQRDFIAAVDTHDLLYRRNQMFNENGAEHWIEISRDEESRALQQFDLIIATQDVEAQEFRSMAPSVDVVVIGHDHQPTNSSIDRVTPVGRSTDSVRIGIIGSDNAANRDGLLWFVKHCWDEELAGLGVELIVAGEVSKVIGELNPQGRSRIQDLGVVHPLEAFYDEVDFVINPTRFGSGIKIKTIEAFRFGKPLVAHSHSTQGLSDAAKAGIFIADDPTAFGASCQRLITDANLRRTASDHMLQIASAEFSSASIYSDLSGWLEDSRPSSKKC